MAVYNSTMTDFGYRISFIFDRALVYIHLDFPVMSFETVCHIHKSAFFLNQARFTNL